MSQEARNRTGASAATDVGAGVPALSRRLGLPLLVLYGVGITVGAGIYVLIGTVAGHAGVHAPWAFVLAAIVMAFTVASYAELSTRYPVSAGEAAYVRAAFGSRLLSRATGATTILIGIVSSAAVALGAAGYIREFVDWPQHWIALAVILALGLVAAWGILQSVVLAGLFTLVEVGGLVVIVAAALLRGEAGTAPLPAIPAFEAATLSGIAFASLLAFFAFIGFEDLANAVEEAKDPRRDLPRAMVLTLVISTVLYVAIAVVAVAAVPPERLASSPAPLSLVFSAVTHADPAPISVVAVVATLNTIMAQMTMAARVIYGMARQGDLPAGLGRVHPATRTPVVATAAVVVAVAALALGASLEWLAEWTSLATLAVFAVVNLALLRVKRGVATEPGAHLRVPAWVAALGLFSCVAMIASALLG